MKTGIKIRNLKIKEKPYKRHDKVRMIKKNLLNQCESGKILNTPSCLLKLKK